MSVEIPMFRYLILDIVHKDPIAKRDLYLAVAPNDTDGNPLDFPEVLDVTAFRLAAIFPYPRYYASYKAGTLPAACGAALAREFNARLRVDIDLCVWLLDEVSKMTGKGNLEDHPSTEDPIP